MSELAELFLEPLRRLHDRIRDRVVAATATRSASDLLEIVATQGGDIVFALDRVSEAELLDFFENEIASREPIVLVVEGIPGGKAVLPHGAAEADCRWRVIMDPIDGTRCLTYQKRPGWVLTGVAPNRGEITSLADVELAVQTEIPLAKQHLCDQLWAERGQGAHAERVNRLTGERNQITLQPSLADTLQYGYASVTRFFPGMRDVLAEIDDEIIRAAIGVQPPGGTYAFEDQYPASGGQLYSLLSGSDRFLADLRPLMHRVAAERGEWMGHCCHPYDVCTLLIAEELGVIVTDPGGGPLAVPLDTETDVAWVGYANEGLRRQVAPLLEAALVKRGLL